MAKAVTVMSALPGRLSRRHHEADESA